MTVTTTQATTGRVALRGARADDVEAIAEVWHSGWRDGHLGLLPAEIEPHRRLADFRRRTPPRIPHTTVAVLGSRVLGFVAVREDEIEQMHLAASARGSGVADALLRRGESQIAVRHAAAWLAVATGNARACRFYARNGWRDAGGFEYAAEIDGGVAPVPCRRYVKRLEVTA